MSTEITSGGRIAEWRKAKKLSQQKLADLIGVSRSYLGDIEAGRSDASAKILTSMAKHTDVNSVWLLTGEGMMVQEPPQVQPEPPPLPEPTPEDPLARRKAMLKLLVDQIDDEKGLDEIQVEIEKIEQMRELKREVAELRRKAG